jgi:hypothetical protein
MQRHRPRPAGLRAADNDLQLRLLAAPGRDRCAPPRIRLAAALTDVSQLEPGELGTAQAARARSSNTARSRIPIRVASWSWSSAASCARMS